MVWSKRLQTGKTLFFLEKKVLKVRLVGGRLVEQSQE